jgi:hypothetical protein
MSGRLALDASPEWRALYFPPKDRDEVTPLIPDGHILGVRALARRKWRVWLMTDDVRTQDRRVIWKVDHIVGGGLESCLFALRKYAPTTTVTVDDEDYIRDVAS